jgi:hypothetical protein
MPALVSRVALICPIVLGACTEAPADGLRIEDARTTRDGVDVSLAFERGGAATSPRAAEGGQIRAVVTDTDWGPAVSAVTGAKKQACASTVPVLSGIVDSKKKTATFHLAMSCPPVGTTVTRVIEVTFTPSSGAPKTVEAYLQSYDAAKHTITFSK